MALPSGYKRLNYIQSSGSQYIDTGFKPNQNTRVVMEMEFPTAPTSDRILCGARAGSWGDRMFTITYVNSKSWWQFTYGSSYSTTSVTAAINTRFSVDQNKNVGMVNGVSSSATANTFTSSLNAFIFCQNNGGSASNFSAFRLFRFSMYDNGTLVRDFIPCQKPDGTLGLWDDVNGAFYGNAGSGTFIAGSAIFIDASQVIELEYIQSSGAQCIDSGYVVQSENMRAVLKFAYTAAHSDATLFGSETSGITGSGEYSICPYGTPQYFVGGSKALSSACVPTINEVCTLDITANNGTLTDVWNGNVKKSQSYTQKLNHKYSIAIFGNNISGTISQKVPMKLYSFRLYDNGTLVRDYMAAKLADGTVGLYDKINGLLYINLGDGAFEAGPVVLSGPPTNLRQTLAVRLAWSAVSGATGYKIYRDGVLLGSTTETAYVDTTAEDNQQYTYGVSAFNDSAETEKTTIEVYTKTGYFIYRPIIESANFR